MIPKTINYCWFGRKTLPKSAQKCISSWRRFFPDYEFKEWNEDNFDVNIIPYTQQAYQAKKYAFVSDYARLWVLYNYGGIYFDTDVEVIKSMDDIVERGPFMGIEVPASGSNPPQVNPGLGLGACLGHPFYKVILDKYSDLSFINTDGSFNQKAIVAHTTESLIEYGLKPVDGIQQVEGISIYPSDYFNPLDSLTGRLNCSENTRTIHWYMNSWADTSALYKWLSKAYHRVFGTRRNLSLLIQ